MFELVEMFEPQMVTTDKRKHKQEILQPVLQ